MSRPDPVEPSQGPECPKCGELAEWQECSICQGGELLGELGMSWCSACSNQFGEWYCPMGCGEDNGA